MAQFLRPNSDISNGGSGFFWNPSSGVNLYPNIDEVTPNDSDYIYGSSQFPNSVSCVLRLSSASTPSPGPRILRFRAREVTPDEVWGYITVSIRNASTLTLIEMFSSTNLTDSFVTYSFTITNPITDYSNLAVEISGFHVLNLEVQVSWLEIEIPDAYNHSINSVSFSNIMKVNGVEINNIHKVNSVEI